MTTNIVNTMPYLRTSREYPYEDAHQLSVEVNKTYVDVANAVNQRTIGLFPVNNPAITGESFYLTNQRQQTLRQVYPFGAITAGSTLNIPINVKGVTQYSRIYGTCITSVPDNRPIPYASVVANGNIDLSVTTSNIVIVAGSGGPNIVSGIIILEWITNA